jgi:type IV pilus assembly protein PilA
MKSVKCPECGFVGWADAERCKKCNVLRVPDLTGDSQPSPPTYLQYQPVDPGYSHGKLKHGLAVTSLVIGVVDLFTLGLLGVGAIAGIILAIVALSKAKRNPAEYGGRGLATAGLVTSILSIVMIVPIGIVAAIAIPNLLASRRAANEGASIYTMRMIHSAEVTYQATSGNGSFATLDQLAADQLIDPELATGIHYGYKFTVDLKTTGYDEPPGFQVVGVPLAYRSTGIRSFFTDETGVIRGGDNRGADATEFNEPLDIEDSYSSSSPPSRRYGADSRDY